VGETKEVLSLQMLGTMAEKCCFNGYLHLFFDNKFTNIFHSYKEQREEVGEKAKHEEKSQNFPFATYIYIY
jgi:hypothetical protein